MKIFKPIKAGLLLIVGSLGLVVAQSVMADVGDVISNTVTVNYQTGTTAATPATATVRFLEDRRIDLTVVEQSNAGGYEEGDAGDEVVMQFLVSNASNGVIDISLAALNTNDTHNSDAVDDYDQPVSIYVEDGTTAGFQSAEDTLTSTLDNVCHTAAGSATTATYNANGSIAAGTVDCSGAGLGTSRTVYVVTTMPGGITGTTGQISSVSLAATALAAGDGGALTNTAGADNSSDNGSGAGTAVVSSDNQSQVLPTDVTGSTIDTVFADDDSNGDASNYSSAGTSDVAANGIVSDSDSFRVTGANLVISKTVDVISDPINGVSANAKAIPLAILEYTITIDNDGTGSATEVILSDLLTESVMTYETGTATVSVNGVLQPGTDADDTDVLTVISAAGTTTITVGNTVASGESTITLAADDGDGAGAPDGGPDEAVIVFRVELQ